MTPAVPDLPGLTDLAPLGRGGLADVYLARQVHLDRWVAAKVFRVTLDDATAAERFRAECGAIGRLDQYPHVITVYDAGVLPDGRPYLISERCDGSLHDLVTLRGPLDLARVAAIGSTIGRALRYAHSAGVLHGDVTPANVLLRASGAPVLADFGLAVLRDHARRAAGFTAVHAAPEIRGPGAAIDERADVYGLGSTLWTALTGEPPPRPDPGGPTAGQDPPAAPATVLTAMLAADAAQRPSLDEVIDSLEAGTGARTAGDRDTLVATMPGLPPAEPAAPAVRPWPSTVAGRRRTASGNVSGSGQAAGAAGPEAGTGGADPIADGPDGAAPGTDGTRSAGIGSDGTGSDGTDSDGTGISAAGTGSNGTGGDGTGGDGTGEARSGRAGTGGLGAVAARAGAPGRPAEAAGPRRVGARTHRSRGRRRALLVAGGATVALLAGAGATVAWRMVDADPARPAAPAVLPPASFTPVPLPATVVPTTRPTPTADPDTPSLPAVARPTGPARPAPQTRRPTGSPVPTGGPAPGPPGTGGPSGTRGPVPGTPQSPAPAPSGGGARDRPAVQGSLGRPGAATQGEPDPPATGPTPAR